jgi:hypothetical protein
VEWEVYCENFVMIGLIDDAGDNLKNRAPILLAPCVHLGTYIIFAILERFQNATAPKLLFFTVTGTKTFLKWILLQK